MGGTLEPEDTPGGGLTMSLSLPAAPAPPGLPDLAVPPGTPVLRDAPADGSPDGRGQAEIPSAASAGGTADAG
jgi:two-component system, OmpR family, sensor histidine kinase KdpD